MLSGYTGQQISVNTNLKTRTRYIRNKQTNEINIHELNY